MRSAFESGVQAVATWPAGDRSVTRRQVDFQFTVTDIVRFWNGSLWNWAAAAVATSPLAILVSSSEPGAIFGYNFNDIRSDFIHVASIRRSVKRINIGKLWWWQTYVLDFLPLRG